MTRVLIVDDERNIHKAYCADIQAAADRYEWVDTIVSAADAIMVCTAKHITEPVVGANPDFNIVSADESKYTVTVVKWNLLDGSSYPVLTAGDKFVRGESYQLDVKFVANPGYEFSDSCVFNVNGVPSAAYSL